jgi:hypothetical protein
MKNIGLVSWFETVSNWGDNMDVVWLRRSLQEYLGVEYEAFLSSQLKDLGG